MAIAAVGLFFLAYQWGNQYQLAGRGPPALDGVLIRPPQPLPELTLSGPDDALTRADLIDHWSLIALAPPADVRGHLAVARMVEIANRLVAEPTLRERLRLLLISDDDTPRLARDFQRLTPALWVLTADADTLSRLRMALGAGSSATDGDGPPALFLIDPKARLAALFPGAQAPDAIAADITALAEWPGLLAEPNPDPSTDANTD
jgi:hypothetical protein